MQVNGFRFVYTSISRGETVSNFEHTRKNQHPNPPIITRAFEIHSAIYGLRLQILRSRQTMIFYLRILENKHSTLKSTPIYLRIRYAKGKIFELQLMAPFINFSDK